MISNDMCIVNHSHNRFISYIYIFYDKSRKFCFK